MRHYDVIEPTATVADGVLYLADFEERDPEVVNLVDASDDAVSAVHRAMQVGARALALAKTSIDANLVEQAFDGMSRSFDGTLGETIEQIGKIVGTLLDEETGELPRALKQFHAQLDELLGDAFDEDSKKSVLAKLERLMDEAAKRQVAAVKRVVDPDDPESPLGRHRQEIVKAVKEVGDSVSKAVAEVSEKIAVTKVQIEMAEKAASKGFAFEDVVHEAVSRVAISHGDLAEQVGTVTGASGTKAGDEAVTLALDDTRGATARYVLELKDRKLGQKATFEELDRAMANRESAVGVAVFSREELAPIAGPFSFWGNYAIVVLDKDTLDDGALRLACLWARWMVRRQLADDGSEVSLDRVAGLIDEARRALDRVTTVRRCHTSATKRISEAMTQVDDLATEIETVLNAIATEVSK
jgi:hypothetical protein